MAQFAYDRSTWLGSFNSFRRPNDRLRRDYALYLAMARHTSPRCTTYRRVELCRGKRAGLVQSALQNIEPWLGAELEETIQVVAVSLTLRAGQLVPREGELRIDSSPGGLDLD